jgi:hypothetical protein
MYVKCLVNGHSVWWLWLVQSDEYQETTNKGQSSVFWLMFAEADMYFDTCTLNVLLNWEVTLFSNKQWHRGRLFWRENDLLLGLHVLSYEPQDTGSERDTAVIIKGGGGDGGQFTMWCPCMLYHEVELFQNSCSVCQICKTHACFLASFRILPCRSGLMIRGRNGG